MAIIIPANSAADTAFSVANSCRFNTGDSPSMSKTSGTATNVDICTVSAWVKSCGTASVDEAIMGEYTDASNRGKLLFHDSDKLHYFQKTGGSTTIDVKTTRVLRDPAAWHHIVVAFDSTQATDTDRIKFYVNGVQETAFDNTSYPSSGQNIRINESSAPQFIGQAGAGAAYFNGYLAEVCFIDGQQLTPSSFGEYDEDSPTIWKPKDVSELTFGTNGFYLDFEDSSNLGNDANGGTDLGETNIVAADSSTDTPTNNFATMNPLDNIGATTFSEGNNLLLWTATNKTSKSTIGMTAGKWYAECQAVDVNSGVSGTLVGVGTEANLASTYLSEAVSGWGYRVSTGNIQNGAGNEAYGDGYTDGDIIGVAVDVDNGYVYMSKNGTFQDSGDPTSGSSGTGAGNNQPTHGAALSGTQFFACSSYDTDSLAWNFGGSPAFAISSGNADANGYGNFEYAVPSGYLSLCTKNLGSDGG